MIFDMIQSATLATSFRIPLLPGFCGRAPARGERAMIGRFRSSRASSVASVRLPSTGNQLVSKFIDGSARGFGHADDVGFILRRGVVKGCFGVVNAFIRVIQKAGDIRTLHEDLAKHNFEGKKPAGKLAAVVYGRIVHGGSKPLFSLRFNAALSCGPP